MNINRSVLLFLQFLRRDIYIYKKRITKYIINFALIYPVLFSFCFGYIQANTYFGAMQKTLGTIVFIGNILLIMIILTFTITSELLFDLANERFIDYQMSILHPRLVLLERIIFTSLFTFCMLLPFYPISKLILGNSFDTTHLSWPAIICMLYVSSLCCAAYHILAMCILKGPHLMTRFWMRINHPLFFFGGFRIPRNIMTEFSPLLGYLNLANPMIYVTEGLRQAAIGSTQFLPLWICIIALLIFSLLFTLFAFYFFKKRVDHI